MLDKIPNGEEMTALLGTSLYDVWNQLCAFIDERYDMDCLWGKGGKAWKYEYMNINTVAAAKRCVHYMQEKLCGLYDCPRGCLQTQAIQTRMAARRVTAKNKEARFSYLVAKRRWALNLRNRFSTK